MTSCNMSQDQTKASDVQDCHMVNMCLSQEEMCIMI